MFGHPMDREDNIYFNAAIYLIQCTLDKLRRTANDNLLCHDLYLFRRLLCNFLTLEINKVLETDVILLFMIILSERFHASLCPSATQLTDIF